MFRLKEQFKEAKMRTLRLRRWIAAAVVVFAALAFSVIPAAADWNDGPDVGPGTGGNGTTALDTGGILPGTDSPDTGDDPGTLRGVNRNPQGKGIAEERSGFSFLISIAKTVVYSFWK